MKNIYIMLGSCTLLAFAQFSSAQDYAYKKADIYLLKSDFSAAANIANATYLLQILKMNDTTYCCRYYNKYGPMLRMETFLDSNLSVPNGDFAWYDTNGNLDSLATVYRGIKTRFTSYKDELTRLIFVRYENGKVYEKRDYLQNIYIDSAGNTGNLSEKEKEEHNKFVADSIASKPVPAKFGENGKNTWAKYVEKHILVPDRFTQVMQTGTYEVLASFLVNKEGKVCEVFLLRSCEFSADLEVFSLFENSPPWHPAILNGENVIYRQKESFGFQVGN